MGEESVDSDGFLAARLPAVAAKLAIELAEGEGYVAVDYSDSQVDLPFHSFDGLNRAGRTSNWPVGVALSPAPVPGLFVLTFGFPTRTEWIGDLKACGVEVQFDLGRKSHLVRASSIQAIVDCPAAKYLAWAFPYLSTDRIDPRLLDRAEADGWLRVALEFLPGTDLDAALDELPKGTPAPLDYHTTDGGTLSVQGFFTRHELESLLAQSKSLAAIVEAGDAQPSDERQGLIVAGGHNGVLLNPSPPAPRYATWLSDRQLTSAQNQQIVAVADTGYDDGGAGTPAIDHHLDIESPERLVANRDFRLLGATTPDPTGHGTFVSGIIVGSGGAVGASQAVDSQGYYLGSGIAPQARIAFAKIYSNACSDQGIAVSGFDEVFGWSRSDGSVDRAFIFNYSSNFNISTWDDRAKKFDERVLDADLVRSGNQTMTVVVSAGNSGSLGAGTVRTPATGKNVISVGSTLSYRPSNQPGAPSLACEGGFSSTQEADHVGKVNSSSSRGALFAPFPSAAAAHNTRIKPDVVAPGGRSVSTVPYNSPSTYTCQGLCRKFWPGDSLNPQQYHTVAQGTSFSAPVVSGVAALLRKWFLDRFVTPSPSLIKAALAATADTLGAANGGDHRPSHLYGWGRVSLDRLTDSAKRFYRTDLTGHQVSQGTVRSWTRTIDEPSRATYIAIAWSDPATAPTGSVPPLINDLSLAVELVGSSVFWRGNNFRENKDGIDDGTSHAFALGGDPILSDVVNTVEAVFIPAGTFSSGQQITMRVTGVTVPQGPQMFAIYAYNVRP